MKKRWMSTALVFCVTLALLSAHALADEPHVHVWSEEWSITDSKHWHACTAENCPGITQEDRTASDCDEHAYDWVTVTEPTYISGGSEQRTCHVCAYTEEQDIPQLILPDYFTVTIVDLSTGQTAEQQMPTAGGASYTVPEDGVYVDSDTQQVMGTLPLASDLTLYKLVAGPSVPGTCTSKAYTVYSGTLPDVPRTLTVADCTFVSLGLYDDAPGNCDQTYKYTLPKCKIRVHSPTSEEVEAFSWKNTVPEPDLSYYGVGVHCYMAEKGDYNAFAYGLLYGYPVDNMYRANGGEYTNMDMENGDTFVLDFTDEVTVMTSHRELLKNCEILEDKEATVTVYGDYEHIYEAEWTVDVAPTTSAPGSQSRHCTLCDAKTDVTAIPALIPQPDSSYDYYTITADAGDGGAISPSGSVRVRERRDKTFAITPEADYVIADVLVDGESVGAVESYTFERVTRSHTIEAHFQKEKERPVWNPFEDVWEGDWFHDDVKYVYENGLMIGTSADKFSPDWDTSRGMIVTILWRLEREPRTAAAMPFDDVNTDNYSYEAVRWAAEHEIVKGYNAITFGPDNAITRQELAAILYRYSQYKGYDVSASDDLMDFTDRPDPWAGDAVRWAVGAGILSGRGGGILAPRSQATRAEAAAMLTRYLLDGGNEGLR